jgi:APA family basic amino acid/polyamine antiporter
MSNINSNSKHNSNWFRRKPLWVVAFQEAEQATRRHLTLFDLISVGIGGTIGSGIFVLAGYIAHHFAGPATVLSFAASGLAACCSGVCYAELAGRLPASGSTYVYTYVAMGEIAAVVAAACLTLEYAASGAAVARSWGDKVVLWLQHDLGFEMLASFLNPGYGLNPMAFLISAASVALLLNGVKESKFVSNIFTSLKLLLVLFMIVGGFYFFNSKNLVEPDSFAPFGVSGVLRGATSSFFGYLGYDEVCCIAGEALHPHRDMPRAVLLTLGTVAIIYMTAALALVGMQPYTNIDDVSSFPAAFSANGAVWAMHLTAAGEVITLPVVVLISLMAQPRLQLAMVQDGLLPHIFGNVDARGNLTSGTWIAGSVMSVVAGCVPFSYLDDLISAGILVAFCMTNSCLVLMRCESPTPNFLPRGLLLYNALCFVTSLSICHGGVVPFGIRALLGGLTLLVAGFLAASCPRSASFGGSSPSLRLTNDIDEHGAGEGTYFESPCVPLIPFVGIFVNCYLIAELEWSGLLLLSAYLGMTVVLYLSCCSSSYDDEPSTSNSHGGWKSGSAIYSGLDTTATDAFDDDNNADSFMMSAMPRRKLAEVPDDDDAQ